MACCGFFNSYFILKKKEDIEEEKGRQKWRPRKKRKEAKFLVLFLPFVCIFSPFFVWPL
jgi:hypothetical protein